MPEMVKSAKKRQGIQLVGSAFGIVHPTEIETGQIKGRRLFIRCIMFGYLYGHIPTNQNILNFDVTKCCDKASK